LRWQAKQAQNRLYQLYQKKRLEMSEEKPFLFSSEPIIGYRCFRWGACEDVGSLFDLVGIAPEGENPFAWARKKRLMSAAYQGVWPELQPMVAQCNADGRHHAAEKGCGCGLWAVKTKESALAYSYNYHAFIVAEVALWGRFIEHDKGWRGQYGYPQKVWVVEPAVLPARGWTHADYLEHARAIGEQYQIPAEIWKLDPVKPTKPARHNMPLTYTSTIAATAWSTSTTYAQQWPTPSVPPANPWPSTIVHPSELFSTITLPEQVAVYLTELPF